MKSFEKTVRQALARVRARRTGSAPTPRATPGWHRALLLGEPPYRCEPTTWGLEEAPTSHAQAPATWSSED